MKKINYIIAGILGTFLMSCAIANTTLPSPTASVENLNTVVAVVNDQIITQNDFNTALAQATQQMAAAGTPGAIDSDKLKQAVLNQLIDEKLQLELAEQAGIKVSDAQVTQAIAHIAESNHLSVAQLKQKLSQEGMSYSSYYDMIHKQLLIHQVQQNAIGSTINVTNQDIKKAQAEYQAQTNAQQSFHVIDLLANNKKQAIEFEARLKKGDDINTIAPNQTKDLGWQTTNTLPSIFLQQLSHMQTGDISPAIQAPNGYHIIKLVGVKNNTAAPTIAQLRNYAYQIKFQKAAEKWLKNVRSTAYIKITQ